MRDLSLHLMDIVQNSVSAGAGLIEVSIAACKEKDSLTITISDNGSGMDEEFLKKVTNPFTTTRTTRKVGLGIPMFKDSAQMAGGELSISSVKNKGTTLIASFKISHIDRLPLGSISETMIGVIMSHPDIRWVLNLSNQKDKFFFDSFEIKERLGDVPITEHEVLAWIKDYIDEAIKDIFGGVLDEIIG